MLFNLDISGSMDGKRWNNVCKSVESLIETLGDGDFVAGLVFNDESKLLDPKDFDCSHDISIDNNSSRD